MRLLGLALVVLGVLAAVYGGFWYTKKETKAEVGPIKLEVESREHVNVPLWVGIGAILGGTAIVLTSKRPA